MKKLTILYFALILGSLTWAQSQENILETQISIEIKNKTVDETLELISEQFSIYFSYDPEILSSDKRINKTFTKETLGKVLEHILDKSLDIKVINKQVIIFQDQNSDTQKQTIRGRIVDKDIHIPLVGATVILKGTNPPVGTITDNDGFYELKKVPVGRQSVKITYIGYKPVYIDNFLVLSAKEKILNIELEESIEDIKEVQVSAYASKADALNEMASVGARSFTIEETEKYAGSWGDPSRMAMNYAGVVVAGDERNDIVIRGNSPTALIWQLEGMPIPSPNHFDNLGATGGPVSILNNNTLARSDFFTGAFPAEYGNGYSGVFDLHMRNGNYKNYEFTAQLGFGGFEAGAEGPLNITKNSSFLINYRYSMLGVVDEFLWIDELPHYQDFNYKINIPYKKGNISMFGFGGASYIEFFSTYPLMNSEGTIKSNEKDASRTLFNGINHTHFINQKVQLINAISGSFRNPYSEIEFIKNNVSTGVMDDYKDVETNYSYSTKLIAKINSRNKIKTGVRIENASIGSVDYYDSVDGDSISYYKNVDFHKYNLYTLNAFTDYQYKIAPKLTLNTGLHYQHFFFNNTKSLEPRLSMKYQYSKKGKIGIAYGNHCQEQPLYGYFISVNQIDFPNKNLDFTRSHQYVIGHDYSFTQNLRLKVEAYYQSLYDVPVLRSQGSYSTLNYGKSDDLFWADSLINQGTGENYGVDITFEKFLKDGYYFLLTSSIFNSTYKGYDQIKRNTRYNGKYVFNALGGYEFNIGTNSLMNLNVRLVYAGGMWDMPIDAEASNNYHFTVYNTDLAYSDQMDDYFRFDFRIGFVLQLKKFTHEIGFEITNLTNHKNESYKYYDFGQHKVISAYQQGFFPMGLYRISF